MKKFTNSLLITGGALLLTGCVVFTAFGVGKEFDEAFKAGNWSQAALVYESDPAFFHENAELGGFGPQLDLIADEINKNLASRLTVHENKLENQVWPQRAQDWPVTSNFLRESETILTDYNQYALLKRPEYRNEDFDVFAKDVAKFRGEVKAGASDSFKEFDHFGSSDFFKKYPIFLPKSKFLTANYKQIEERMENANVGELESFLSKYKINKDLVSIVANKVEKTYLNALVMEKTGGKKPDLLDTWEIYQAAESKGIDSKSYLKDSITMIEVPSLDRVGTTAIEFSISVKKDKKVLNRKISIEKVLLDNAVKKAEYVVVVDLAAAQSKFEDMGKSKAQSRYYTHSDWLHNPEYSAAQQAVNTATMGVQQAQASYNQALSSQAMNSVSTGNSWMDLAMSVTSTIVSTVGVDNANSRLAEANATFANTPAQIEHKRYTPYNYQRVSVNANKDASINYFIIDRSTNKYVQGTVTKTLKKNFVVLEDLNQQDPDLAKVKKGTVSRDELDDWLVEPEPVTFDEIIADYRQRRRKAARLPSDVLVQQDLFDQRNNAVKVAMANQKNKTTTIVEATAVTAKTTEVGYGKVAEFNFPKGKTNNNAYAVIIGVKDYDNKDIPTVDFALNDAEAIRQYLIKTRGFKPENVNVLENPNQSELMSYFGTETNHKGKLFDSVTRRDMKEVFVFYSGHGIPTSAGTGVMLPKDADPQKPEFTGYALATLVGNLNKLDGVDVTLAVDACFSGVSAGGTLVKSASPLYLGSSNNGMSLKNGTVFTAADGKEIASWDNEIRLGLFTKHLLQGFVGKADKAGNNDGQVIVSEMLEYLRDSVGAEADKRFGRRQTPQVFGNMRSVVNTSLSNDFASLESLMSISQ